MASSTNLTPEATKLDTSLKLSSTSTVKSPLTTQEKKTLKSKMTKKPSRKGDSEQTVSLTWNSLHNSEKAKSLWSKAAGKAGRNMSYIEPEPPSMPHDSTPSKASWRKAGVVRPNMSLMEPVTEREPEKEKPRKSIISTMKKTPDSTKMKLEVLKLWDSAQNLMKKQGEMTEDDIEKLRRIIQESVDLSGRIRMLVREKETYTDEDVLNHAKDINNLQLFLHTVVEIWTKVNSPLKEKYANRILTDMMEQATDVCSVYGEVMSTFLQRFGLDIVPLLRPVHGLFYSISIHCRYHCPDLAEDDVNELKAIYNSFLTALVSLCKSTKVLLKRLKFDQETIANRRRMVQTHISSVIETMRDMVKDGRVCSAPEYVDTIERIGSLCTDIFFVIGKTTGIAELLELGEGVTAIEPADVLGEVAHSDVQRCPIEQRPVLLKGLQIEEGGSFISDVFMQTGSMFNPSQKVTLRMPYSGAPFPPGAIIKVKLKIGEDWYDTPGSLVGKSTDNEVSLPEGVAKVNIKTDPPKKTSSSISKTQEELIEFQCKFMQAFVATVEYLSTIKELTPAGYIYICPEDDRVRVSFPEGCVPQTVALAFKLIQINRSRMFDYKEQCPNLCKNIVAVSDCLKIDHDDEVICMLPVTVHLPIPNDIDDNESEIVILRSRDDGEVEIIPKRTAMTCPSALNCYTFQIQNLSGIAIGKVKKKHLRKNRSAIIEEYELYTESAFICNILTFLDKSLLHVGMVKLFVEVVERRFLKKALRRRAKEGLFEVPGSRSPNISLRNEDIVCVETDGNIQRMREIPLENYFIVFLSSARDNFRSFPVEQRQDPDGRTYGLVNFYKDNEEDQVFLHCAHIDANKYLINMIDKKNAGQGTIPVAGAMTPRSFGGSWISRPATRSARESVAYRAVFDEVPVLSHQSLLSLATYLRADTIQNVSYELGIPYEDVIEQKMSGQPPVIINFNLLWKWRGHKPRKEMISILTRAFRICGHGNVAEGIEKALVAKRALTKDDFK